MKKCFHLVPVLKSLIRLFRIDLLFWVLTIFILLIFNIEMAAKELSNQKYPPVV
jgi:hypothetical protein